MAEGKFLVAYKVEGKPYTAGPYDTEEIAQKHLDDIAGFEGVTDARIQPQGSSVWDRLLSDE